VLPHAVQTTRRAPLAMLWLTRIERAHRIVVATAPPLEERLGRAVTGSRNDEFRASTPTIGSRSLLLGKRQQPMPTAAVGP
jgi:hypothetical protein